MENDQQRAEMLAINERQRSFYDTEESHDRCNTASQIWWKARGTVGRVRKQLAIMPLVHRKHREWLGDMHGKRVLDLGCYAGSKISLLAAEQADFYLGVDLSEVGIAKLQAKLDEQNFPNAQAKALDFLAPDFPYEPFDIIYATSVLHHFKHFETLLQLMHARLKPGGHVVSFDPMQTATLNRMARAMYRPFQSDSDWEYPFTKKTFQEIQKYFRIEDMQGVMGCAKWAVPIAYIPGAGGLASRMGQKWHDIDLREARTCGPGLWRCMQVAIYLQRRDDVDTSQVSRKSP